MNESQTEQEDLVAWNQTVNSPIYSYIQNVTNQLIKILTGMDVTMIGTEM